MREEDDEPPSSIKQDSDNESLEFVPDPNFLEEMNKRMAVNDRLVLHKDDVNVKEVKLTKWKIDQLEREKLEDERDF